MAHGNNEADYWDSWTAAVHKIADDALLQIERGYESTLAHAERRFVEFEQRQPQYVSQHTLHLLQEATKIAIASATDHLDFYYFRLPSIYCDQAPLLITSVPVSDCDPFQLAHPLLSKYARWHINTDRGQETTWRDNQGIVLSSCRFFPAEYHNAPNAGAVDTLLEAEKWSLPGVRLLNT